MATDRPIHQLTFREKIRDGAHLARELVEHVELSLLPRLAQLESGLTPRPGHGDDDIADVTVRNLVASALESEQYATALDARIEALGQAIVQESQRILNAKG
uniref:Uncharacterized protein n=1 Tax=Schlesneria paludicola TaxID=360056 RepID=A0A7C2P2D1_9PLAN